MPPRVLTRIAARKRPAAAEDESIPPSKGVSHFGDSARAYLVQTARHVTRTPIRSDGRSSTPGSANPVLGARSGRMPRSATRGARRCTSAVRRTSRGSVAACSSCQAAWRSLAGSRRAVLLIQAAHALNGWLALYTRVGMSVNCPPLSVLAPEDQSHAQLEIRLAFAGD